MKWPENEFDRVVTAIEALIRVSLEALPSAATLEDARRDLYNRLYDLAEEIVKRSERAS